MPKSDQIKITNRKIKSKSSKKWLRRQLGDPFVEKSRLEGYRSRAVYKLQEMQEKFRLIGKNGSVLDLGCAPGSWLQLVATITTGKIMGIDLLDVLPVSKAKIIKEDISSQQAYKMVQEYFESKVDVILSDMAANTIGQKSADHLRTIALCEKALYFSDDFLKQGGNLVMKFFDGSQSLQFLNETKKRFKIVKIFKPKASRSDSSESYIVALDKR